MFANSSCSMSAMDAKLSLITAARGVSLRGRRKTIRYGPEERCTDSHSYGNRHHVFRAFTDGECEILDTLLSCKRQFNAQEETLALSGTQSHLGGPLYTNKLQKNCMCCGFPKPNCQTACFGYIFPGWCYLYTSKSYIATKCKN